MFRYFKVTIDWIKSKFPLSHPLRLTFDKAEVEFIATTTQRTTSCITHSGLAYRGTNNIVYYLHFAGHETLKHGVSPDGLAYCIPPLKEEDGNYLAGFCALVWEKSSTQRELPYTFEYDLDFRIDKSGKYLIRDEPTAGVSCSTFVAALFRSAGHNLIDFITWPRQASEDDVAKRTVVLGWWEKSHNLGLIKRAKELRPIIRSSRVSPEQVAGAACANKLPVGYRCACKIATEVMKTIDSQYGIPTD